MIFHYKYVIVWYIKIKHIIGTPCTSHFINIFVMSVILQFSRCVQLNFYFLYCKSAIKVHVSEKLFHKIKDIIIIYFSCLVTSKRVDFVRMFDKFPKAFQYAQDDPIEKLSAPHVHRKLPHISHQDLPTFILHSHYDFHIPLEPS